MPVVTALLTCHNRREQTLRCLDSYFGQRDAGVNLAAVLVDDGCADGTAEAVRSRFPQIDVVPGSGTLYWAGGMALAQRHAVTAAPDHLLWLNDDVILDPAAVRTLVGLAAGADGARLVAGAVRDSRTGQTSYSGVRRTSRRPRGFERVSPSGRPQEIDAFEGNVVLVPRPVYLAVGTVDARLVHAYGDQDYALRARRCGYRAILAPDHLGECARNPVAGTWRDAALSRRRRLALLFGPKGLPVGPHLRYSRRHGGGEWPVYVLGCYGKALAAILAGRQAWN